MDQNHCPQASSHTDNLSYHDPQLIADELREDDSSSRNDDENPISDVLASTLRRTGEAGPGVSVIDRARNNALYAETHINSLKIVDDHLKFMALIADRVAGYSMQVQEEAQERR